MFLIGAEMKHIFTILRHCAFGAVSIFVELVAQRRGKNACVAMGKGDYCNLLTEGKYKSL